MLVIGITGIIGSGKSLAVEYLAEKGYVVYDMDSKAKELMATDESIKQKIKKAFGEESFTPDGAPNTEFISQSVFGQHNNKKLDLLNSIVHPAVIDDMIAFAENEMDNGTEVVFLESALILESGLDEGCDYIINIDSTKEICLERVMARSGLTEAQIQERMNSQFSPEQKRQFADFTINNNSTKKDFFSALDLILDIVLSLPEKEFDDSEE